MERLELKKKQRERRQGRVRRKVVGSAARPRMTVFRSNRYLYLQVIDDASAATLAAASTLEQELREYAPNKVGAAVLGKLMGERLKSAGLSQVVFDRNGYRYHGVIKAVAEAVRAEGIQF